MTRWTMQPQEQEGDYFFTGKPYMTSLVNAELSLPEIVYIHTQAMAYVATHNGADYLFVFTDTQNRKLFLIDSLSENQLKSGNYSKADNYHTLMFAHEY